MHGIVDTPRANFRALLHFWCNGRILCNGSVEFNGSIEINDPVSFMVSCVVQWPGLVTSSALPKYILIQIITKYILTQSKIYFVTIWITAMGFSRSP